MTNKGAVSDTQAEVTVLCVMLSAGYMYEEWQRKFSSLNTHTRTQKVRNPVIALFLFHTVSLRAKRLEDFKEVHNLL